MVPGLLRHQVILQPLRSATANQAHLTEFINFDTVQNCLFRRSVCHMLKALKSLHFRRLIRGVYTQRFKKFGRQPSGIYWTSKERQFSRFAIIIQQVASAAPQGTISIADIGCGYGAMVDYLQESAGCARFRYSGYDINPQLIRSCRANATIPAQQFQMGDCPAELVDFTVMSGTYNMAVTKDIDDWERYFLDCLERCWRYSRRGMVFNLLAADQSYISNGMLYHSDVNKIRRYCRAKFGATRVIRKSGLPSDATLVVMR